MSTSCIGTLRAFPSLTLRLLCPLPGAWGSSDELGDEGGMWIHLSCAIITGTVVTDSTLALSQMAHFSSLQRLRSDPALRSPSLPHRRVPSYRSGLCPPCHPSITRRPIQPELVLSGISGGILQRDLGQSVGIPFPLRLPALAALPLLLIVRGAPGGQWAIQ